MYPMIHPVILFNAATVFESFHPMYGIIHDAVLWVSFENGQRNKNYRTNENIVLYNLMYLMFCTYGILLNPLCINSWDGI